jgi:uncharacterized glyoxalase superfamily protein PhnB
MHTITPHLVCRDAAAAIASYQKAFGAVELARSPGPQGKLLHAMLRIGDSPLMLVDEFPDWGALGPQTLKGSPVTIHLYVEDVDAAVERAVAAGARLTMPVADMFWGDRYGTVEDPFGHRWSIATHIRDLGPEEIQAAANALADRNRSVFYPTERKRVSPIPEETAMVTQIFVNLPVKDLRASVDFFTQTGFSFDEKFTDETATCMIVGENIFVMLLTYDKFRTFTPKPICDASTHTEVLVSLNCDSREQVDDKVRRAVAAGG